MSQQTITATYLTTTVNFPAGTTVDAARAALAPTYPEIANASHDVDAAGNITFNVKSGKKG